MKLIKRRAGGEPVLRRSIALLCGTGLAGVLFGNLMVPSYGAGDLAKHGIPEWQTVTLAGVGNMAVAVAGFVLAMTGWRPRWQWVAGAMAVAAAGLLGPLLLPAANAAFVPLAGVAMAIFGFGAGIAQLAEQTAAVASVAEKDRSDAVGTIMRWHLLGGIVLGGIPFFFSWQAGQVGLAVTFGVLAAAVAVRRRRPDPGTREWYGVRRLLRETGPGSVIVAIGMAAWVVMYQLPGILGMGFGVIALYAAVAQSVTWVTLDHITKMADRNRPLAAAIGGTTLLAAFLGVAIFPAVITTGAGVWVGLACFVVGEVSANFFITAIEGLISVEVGGQRAQLAGHGTKFAAVGVVGGFAAILSGILTEQLGAAGGAIALGATVVVSLGVAFGAGLYALQVRHRRSVARTDPEWREPFRVYDATALGRAFVQLCRIDQAAKRAFAVEDLAELPGDPTILPTEIENGGVLRTVDPTARALRRRRGVPAMLVFVEVAGRLFALERVRPGLGPEMFAVWSRGEQDSSDLFDDRQAAVQALRGLLEAHWREITGGEVERELPALPSIVAELSRRPGRRPISLEFGLDAGDMRPVYESPDGGALTRRSARRATAFAVPLPDGQMLVAQWLQTGRGSAPALALFDTARAGEQVKPFEADLAAAIADRLRPFLEPSWAVSTT